MDYKEEQESEVEALESIYPSEFKRKSQLQFNFAETVVIRDKYNAEQSVKYFSLAFNFCSVECVMY